MKIKNKKVLLTGGAGFIGNNFLLELYKENPSDILVIDKLSSVSNTEVVSKLAVSLGVHDINSPQAYSLVLNFKPDILINMAAESHVDVSIKNPDLFLDSNVYGTVNLLNAALRLETMPLFVQISTDEVYGSLHFYSPSSEESDRRITSSPYSASKAAAEHFVESYRITYGLPILITRSSNNYGPFQANEKFIPKAIQCLLKDDKIPVYGDGKNVRNWIHVQDNCLGILKAIQHYPLDEDIKEMVFNVSSDDEVSNLEIINQLCFLLDKDPFESIQYVPDRLGHDLRYSLNHKRLTSFSGWKPKVPLSLGLAKTLEWYKKRI